MTAKEVVGRVFSFRTALALSAGVLPAALIIIFVFLISYAWPAIGFNGFDFFTHSNWNTGDSYGTPVLQNGIEVPAGAQFQVLFLIGGTLLTVLIATIIAVPVGVAAAVFLAEVVPQALRSFVSFFVELLAAVPSVVFGLWGIAVITAGQDASGNSLYFRCCAWIAGQVDKLTGALSHLEAVPVLGWIIKPIDAVIGFFGGDPGNSYGLLAAGVVLSFMIVPLITSTVRDALISQPAAMREASVALGARKFETIRKILLPGVRSVTIGSAILAIGRALGETMAVLMVCGNALNLPKNIFAPISTMASFIASQLDSAGADSSGLVVKSLAEIAIALGLISLIVNTGARLVLSFSGAAMRDRP